MEFSLTAKRREVFGKRLKALRRRQRLPATLYGHGVTAQSLEVALQDFQHVYTKAGESTLVDLRVDDRPPVKVIIQDVQLEPVRGQFLHVDFHQVRMSEKLETEIPLTFAGSSPAVKELGGVLVKSIDTVTVSCLPVDLVPEIRVDISPLKTFEDAIHIRDLQLPPGIKVFEGTDEVVATVAAPRSEAELKALEEKVEEKVEAVEVVGKPEAEAAPPETEVPASPEKPVKPEKA